MSVAGATTSRSRSVPQGRVSLYTAVMPVATVTEVQPHLNGRSMPHGSN